MPYILNGMKSEGHASILLRLIYPRLCLSGKVDKSRLLRTRFCILPSSTAFWCMQKPLNIHLLNYLVCNGFLWLFTSKQIALAVREG
jgi:hypothetical protein